MTKSYWIGVSLESERDKNSCKSWFSPLADEMTPYKSEILCDAETDREKKLRAFMTDPEGQHYRLERTLGGKKFTISCKQIPAPLNKESAHAPATREDIERRIEAAKDRRYEISMSNGRAYSDGSLTEIDRDIRILENQLARMPE